LVPAGHGGDDFIWISSSDIRFWLQVVIDDEAIDGSLTFKDTLQIRRSAAPSRRIRRRIDGRPIPRLRRGPPASTWMASHVVMAVSTSASGGLGRRTMGGAAGEVRRVGDPARVVVEQNRLMW
jgi:hypothetical protein